jgi:molecular chaperone GrpE
MTDKRSKRESELEQHLGELTADLQRVQADFINYRTRMEEEKARTIASAQAKTILKLLPVIDNIERAVSHMPAELANNSWAQGVSALSKSLDKSLADMGVTRIPTAGHPFDPNLHEAISAEGEGDHEIVSEELRPGYMLDGHVIRHSLVKVTRQDLPVEPPEVAQRIIDDTKVEDSDDEVKGED